MQSLKTPAVVVHGVVAAAVSARSAPASVNGGILVNSARSTSGASSWARTVRRSTSRPTSPRRSLDGLP
jgi:hypothetical protein